MVAQTALGPPPGRTPTTEEPTTNSNKSASSVKETNTRSPEDPLTIPTEPSVVVDPVTKFVDASTDIDQPDTSEDGVVPEEIGSGHSDGSDSPDLEYTNEEQDSNGLGKPVSDQDESVFEKGNKTEIPTITDQSNSSVVVTEPLHGSDKEGKCPKATSQANYRDFHRQELELLDKRLNNLTFLLESNRNLRQSVSIVVKNFVFPTITFCAILLTELLFWGRMDLLSSQPTLEPTSFYPCFAWSLDQFVVSSWKG